MNAATLSALRNKRLPRHSHHLFLALGGALVLLLLGSTLWQASANLNALDDLRRQGERIEHLDSMLIQLIEAENAVRGYLLTGNRDHLEPYKKSLATANETLAQIHRDLAPSPENDAALADLSNLVAVKLRTMGDAVQLGIAGPDARAQGKRYTDRIRDRLLGLKAVVAAEAEASFERSTNHVKRTRWVVAGLALAALTQMVILFRAIDRRTRLREQIAAMLRSENERLDALVQERTMELSDLASYLTKAREAEKARLASELHDELGSLLTAAKMELGWVAEHVDDGVRVGCRERVDKLAGFLDRGIALKRRIIDGLRPPLLEELGLVSTLHSLCDEFASGGEETLRVELPEQDAELAPDSALAVFRIAQEALTNIRKHARAKCVTIALRTMDKRLQLEIADDGIGFHDDASLARHHGLAGMKHRVQMCSGQFRLTSRPGQGTRIVIVIPLAALAPVQEGTV
ncbi:MAG TPA: CHASE3 domain-containing protein [Rhodocyclaceae bacterium]|nr:CHASE3 domain-containing protein [Rhodocyclaceae bacterium]